MEGRVRTANRSDGGMCPEHRDRGRMAVEIGESGRVGVVDGIESAHGVARHIGRRQDQLLAGAEARMGRTAPARSLAFPASICLEPHRHPQGRSQDHTSRSPFLLSLYPSRGL